MITYSVELHYFLECQNCSKEITVGDRPTKAACCPYCNHRMVINRVEVKYHCYHPACGNWWTEHEPCEKLYNSCPFCGPLQTVEDSVPIE